MDQEKIFREIIDKYANLEENPEMYLKGFLQTKPLNYWDYVKVETLLTLQETRTDHKDEAIFIMYSQITELLLKSILHELNQITGNNEITEELLLIKINRLNHYSKLLISFFGMMSEGIDYEQYSHFRLALAPASGFQSVQFRYIELLCTRMDNLVNDAGKVRLKDKRNIEVLIENMYWKDAGIDRKTGKKTLTLRQFEEKYQESLIIMAKEIHGKTLEDKILKLPDISPALKEKLKEFDFLYNVKWPMVHLKTAAHFLTKKGEKKKGTGGTEWQKYLHPQFQQRKFFPSLWTENELENWGTGTGAD